MKYPVFIVMMLIALYFGGFLVFRHTHFTGAPAPAKGALVNSGSNVDCVLFWIYNPLIFHGNYLIIDGTIHISGRPHFPAH